LSTNEPQRFSREFKLEALGRKDSGENVSVLARELGVSRKSIYQWRDRYRLAAAWRCAAVVARPKSKLWRGIPTKECRRRSCLLSRPAGHYFLRGDTRRFDIGVEIGFEIVVRRHFYDAYHIFYARVRSPTSNFAENGCGFVIETIETQARSRKGAGTS
jgi:transposase-like protein